MVALKLENHVVLSSAQAEFSRLEMEKRRLLTQPNVGMVVAQFVVQHAHLYVIIRQ